MQYIIKIKWNSHSGPPWSKWHCECPVIKALGIASVRWPCSRPWHIKTWLANLHFVLRTSDQHGTISWADWRMRKLAFNYYYGKSCACACGQFRGSLRFLPTWNLWMACSLRRAILTSGGSWHNSVFDDFGSYQNLFAALQWSRMKRMASQGCFSPLGHKWCAGRMHSFYSSPKQGCPLLDDVRISHCTPRDVHWSIANLHFSLWVDRCGRE